MTQQEKINALELLNKPAVGEILAVYWDDETTKYYSWTRYDEILPFAGNLPFAPIEARLISGGFHQFEINSDQRTDAINLTFDDLDKDITKKFQAHGSVRCELFYHYPEVDLLVSVFWGTLNKPDIYGYKTVQVTVTNGFRSRELLLPRRPHPKECTAIFGGKFTNPDELYTNGCPYDRQLGGVYGLLDPATGEPFLDCERRSPADCIERFGHDDFYLGFIINVPPVVSDPRTGYQAVTKGNASFLKDPIQVIAGAKHIRNLKLLAFRPQAPHYIGTAWEIGEGTIQWAGSFQINGEGIQAQYWILRHGQRGQPPHMFHDLNFPGTAVIYATYGTEGSNYASKYNAGNMSAFCAVHGFQEVAVYSDENTFMRQWTNNRAWWLLECFTNQRFGLGYSAERFDIQSVIDTSNWTKKTVRFVDGSGNIHDSIVYDASNNPVRVGRTMFDAVLEGKPSHEQIANICRSGRISVPFQHDGKFHVRPVAAVTAEELGAAKVFTDRGDYRNIIWADGLPSINFSQVSDEKLVNHIVLTFEEAVNLDSERPITVDDPNQKARAGKTMGDNNFLEVPRKYVGFGIRFLHEAVKLAYSLLWFGELDEGGLKNNLRAEFTVAFEQILGLKKYDIIKIESNLLAGFESPEGNPFIYFRVLTMRKVGNHSVNITAQAYNETVYETFETELPGSDADSEQLPERPPQLPVRRLTFGDAPYYANGNIVIPPISEE